MLKTRMPTIPSDIHKILSKNPKAKATWEDLTPIARRDFVSWVDSAKQPETRKRRIERIPSMLSSGKRRPCCYAVVPMNLYSALNANPKARTVWRGLTPDERRNFIGWIDSAKDPAAHERRIERACALLATGKRHP